MSEDLPAVALVFSGPVLDLGGRSALVHVTDTSGTHFQTGCPVIAGRDVTVPVALGGPGAYTVAWQVVASDGHPVSGSMRFDYRGPVVSGGRAGPLPKCESVAPPAERTDTVAPMVVCALAAAVTAAIVVTALVIRYRRLRRRSG